MTTKRGRPAKNPANARGEYLDVRLEPAEKEAFKKAAELAGLPLSTWVRERLRKISRKELEEANLAIPFLVKRLPE